MGVSRRSCGCSAQSALFVQSLQCWFNHKGGAACLAPALSPGMLTELGETTGRGGTQGLWPAKLSLLNTTEPLAKQQFWDTALPAAWLRTTMAASPFPTHPWGERERCLEERLSWRTARIWPFATLKQTSSAMFGPLKCSHVLRWLPRAMRCSYGSVCCLSSCLHNALIPAAGNIAQAEQDKNTNNVPVC